MTTFSDYCCKLRVKSKHNSGQNKINLKFFSMMKTDLNWYKQAKTQQEDYNINKVGKDENLECERTNPGAVTFRQ